MSFLMPIEDVFSVPGQGTVVTGRIERGVVGAGDKIEIVGIRETAKATCIGVEQFSKRLHEGCAGQNVGIRLGGIKKDEVECGQVLAKPGSLKPYRGFEALAYFLSEEEAGRKLPYFDGDKLLFGFGPANLGGRLVLPGEVEMIIPGDSVELQVELEFPVAVEVGTRVWVGGGPLASSLGAGVVTRAIA